MWLGIMRFGGWLIFRGQENGNVFRGLAFYGHSGEGYGHGLLAVFGNIGG